METLGYGVDWESVPRQADSAYPAPKAKFQVGGLARGRAWYGELPFYSHVSL